MPVPLKLNTSFGSYSTSYEVKDGKLVFTRSLITKRTVLPREEYASERDFFGKILNAEQSPVVLLRK